jgi:hypothetical protein
MAIDGNNFVLLNTGPNDNTEETDQGQISQLIHDVKAGQTITGAYFFATTDWVPWNDTATIKLVPADPCSGFPDPCSPEILLAYADVASVGDFRATKDWERFSYTFNSNEAGSYILTMVVEDTGDHAYSSYLAIDAVRMSEPVCVYKLTGDLNRDCTVNFIDFAMMAENWLIDCNIDSNNMACIGPLQPRQ